METGELLPRLSILAPTQGRRGGLFLLPFSGGFPRPMLSVILPCDARTFLAPLPFGVTARDRPARLHGQYTTFPAVCQGLKRVQNPTKESKPHRCRAFA